MYVHVLSTTLYASVYKFICVCVCVCVCLYFCVCVVLVFVLIICVHLCENTHFIHKNMRRNGAKLISWVIIFFRCEH